MKFLALSILVCYSIAAVWAGCDELYNCGSSFAKFYSTIRRNNLRAFADGYDENCRIPDGQSVHPVVQCIDRQASTCTIPVTSRGGQKTRDLISYICSAQGKTDMNNALAVNNDCPDSPNMLNEARFITTTCESKVTYGSVATVPGQSKQCSKAIAINNCFKEFEDKCGAPFASYINNLMTKVGIPLDKRDTLPDDC